MSQKKPYRYLNVLLAKKEFSQCSFEDFLADDAKVSPMEIEAVHNFDGALFIKNAEESRTEWMKFIDVLAGRKVRRLWNKSSSAVLLLNVKGNVLAFTFGYGRFLINSARFEQDFGLRTALNTLDHESLRSVDLHTLEDQPIQKKTQTARGSEASVFGIDIFRDVLRAVTGSPRQGVNYRNVSGGDAIYSFGINMTAEDLPEIASQLLAFYKMDLYKNSFGWVDNIRRVKDRERIKLLDDRLLHAVKIRDPALVLTIPEIIQWDMVLGFSFTRSKTLLSPTIDTNQYLDSVDTDSVSIESIRRDRVFVTDVHGNEFGHSIYPCLYLEIDSEHTKNVIFGGNWYEIDKSFMRTIDSTLGLIDVCDIEFPDIETWEEDEKKRIETEGDYNKRVAEVFGYYLLDAKLVRSSKTTSPIELCDLLTRDRQLIHVKHKKGGSAGLSHLFAQGNVSAELILGDRSFRRAARRVLRGVHLQAQALLPLEDIRSADYEVVFLILGEEAGSVKARLPFFSKVNLTRTFENLTQRGFKVLISGAKKTIRVEQQQ